MLQGSLIILAFVIIAALMMTKKIPTLLALPLMAVVICLIAGVPARVIREGIDWDICDYISYTEVDETPSPKRETLFSSIFKK